MRNAWILLVVAVCSTMIGCQPSGPSSSQAPVLADANAIGLRLYWDIALPLNAGEKITKVYQMDEMVYCLTSQNRLVARDALTGVQRWTLTIAEPGTPVFRPVHADKMMLSEVLPGAAGLGNTQVTAYDVVMINSSGRLIVVARKDGALLRRLDLPSGASSGGATDGTQFFAGTATARFYGFNVQRGVQTWVKGTNDSVIAPVEYVNNQLFVASASGKIMVSNGLGELLWQRTAGGPIAGPFAVDRRAMFVGCDDSRVYALSMDPRTNFWERPFVCQGPVRQAIQLTENTVFAAAVNDKFYAINLVNGQQRWSMDGPGRVAAVFGADVYIVAGNSIVVADEMLGKTKGHMSLENLNIVASGTGSKGIWTASPGGRLVCLRPTSVGILKAEDVKNATK